MTSLKFYCCRIKRYCLFSKSKNFHRQYFSIPLRSDFGVGFIEQIWGDSKVKSLLQSFFHLAWLMETLALIQQLYLDSNLYWVSMIDWTTLELPVSVQWHTSSYDNILGRFCFLFINKTILKSRKRCLKSMHYSFCHMTYRCRCLFLINTSQLLWPRRFTRLKIILWWLDYKIVSFFFKCKVHNRTNLLFFP